MCIDIKVCIPALHISLGIFLRLFQLFEQACHELDVKLAATRTTSPAASKKFNDYIATLQKIVDLEDAITQYHSMAERNEQLATWFAMVVNTEVQQQVQLLLLKAQQLRQQANSLVSILLHEHNCTQ